jgi:membrane associated rhomboid family serine protease
VFPIGDEHNGRVLTPVVNYTLIAINVLVFFYQLTLSDRALYGFIVRWGAVPAEISSGLDLFALVTSMFLHGGWLHIAGNMLFLWVFGDNVEDTMGHVRYLLFYLLCGLAAGLSQVVIDANSTIPLVGASGAISGVLGAYIVLFPHGKIRTLVFLGFFVTVVLIPAWVQIGLWIVLQFFNGFAARGPHRRLRRRRPPRLALQGPGRRRSPARRPRRQPGLAARRPRQPLGALGREVGGGLTSAKTTGCCGDCRRLGRGRPSVRRA